LIAGEERRTEQSCLKDVVTRIFHSYRPEQQVVPSATYKGGIKDFISKFSVKRIELPGSAGRSNGIGAGLAS